MGLFNFKSSPEKMIGKRFDQAVKEVMKLCGDMPMIAGVMAFNALTKRVPKVGITVLSSG